MASSAAKVSNLRSNASSDYTGFDSMPIGRRWRKGSSSRTMEVIDPYKQKAILEIQAATPEDVDEAYREAAIAQRKWAATPPQEKQRILERAAAIMVERQEEIIGWLTAEAGSTRIRSKIEWEMVIANTLEAATYPFHMSGDITPIRIPGKESFVYRKPVGVVGVVSPWDFSLYLTSRSVAPAIGAGNAVVLKPSSETPISGGLLFAKIYEEAGLPPGILSVVIGGRDDLGDSLFTHPIPRVLSFTGSTASGRRVGEIAGRDLKRACLELGGNSPFVVLSDAELVAAVDAAVFGKFLNSGQICISINRIIVEKTRYSEFIERFTERVKQLKVGDPNDEDTVIGPLINRRQLEKVTKLVEDTIAAGARVLLRGETEGLVMPPVILADVTPNMPAAQEELFGPVAVLIQAENDEHAIAIANDTDKGLSSALCSSSLERAISFAKCIEAGMTHINDAPFNVEENSPFGGEKMSGMGRFGGKWAMDEFTTTHWITVQHSARRYPF